MKKSRIRVLIIILGIGGIFAIAAGMILGKTWRINPHFARKYELQGIDVSHYQGKIDWARIQSQEIDFAFIKATEGSSCADDEMFTTRRLWIWEIVFYFGSIRIRQCWRAMTGRKNILTEMFSAVVRKPSGNCL